MYGLRGQLAGTQAEEPSTTGDSMKTEDVLESVRKERKYQNRIGNKAKEVGEELLLMEEQLSGARQRWSHRNSSVGGKNYHSTMTILRRIAAGCVRTMERHGVGEEKYD